MNSSLQPASAVKRLKGVRKLEDVPSISISRSQPWFDDGNIILQAENTQFRVYRGILAASSSIFADMFSMPQPALCAETMMEGCSVVHLSDSAEDLRYVLEALCQRKHVSVGLKPLPMPVIISFLRLGKKYEIEVLLSEGLRRFSYECPATLDEFDQMEDGAMIENGIILDYINLAHELDLPSALPVAYYSCCRSGDVETIMDGCTRHDGSVVTLSYSDQRICIMGRENLLKAQLESTFAWLRGGADTPCLTAVSCSNARKSLLCDIFLPVPPSIALDEWQSNWETGMCLSCIRTARVAHENGRKKAWDTLPAFFGLPVWKDLLRE